MSSVYRTTVISSKKGREVEYFPYLSQAVEFGVINADVGDRVLVDEVIQDASGEYIYLEHVMDYKKETEM